MCAPRSFAENLRASDVSNTNADTAWANMRGVWNILENTSVAGISSSDLGLLVLSDAVFPENKYPTWLEECDDGYRATDELYEKFGLLSPRRDPSVKDRLGRRIQDPDDDLILHEILNSICSSLSDFGLNDFSSQEYWGRKSASVHAKLTSLTSLKLDDTDREIHESVLPRDLLLVLFLSSTPAEDELEEIISKQCQEDGFVLVLYLEGVDPGRIPFGRFLKELGVKSVFSLSFEVIAQLLSASNEAVGNVIGEWIAQTTKDLFSKKPALGIKHPICRAMISATVSEGVVPIDAFARQRNISQSDAKKALAHLVDPPILIKKGNEISWDPSQDVILKVLMESSPNLAVINNQLRKVYLTPTIDMSDLLTPYEGISGDSSTSSLSSEAIIDHANASLLFHLDVAKATLEKEAQLRDEWTDKINALSSRRVSSLDDVAPSDRMS